MSASPRLDLLNLEPDLVASLATADSMKRIDADFREYLIESGYDISQMGHNEDNASDELARDSSSLDHEKKPHHRVESFTATA